MKRLIIALLVFTVSCICGCGDDTYEVGPQAIEEPEAKAFHEQQFTEDDTLTAHINDTVMLHLESSGTHIGDLTGEGYDSIPFHYNNDVNHTICMADEENDPHYVIVYNDQDEEIIRINAGECKTEFMPAGDYRKEIHHAEEGNSAEYEMVFIRPHSIPKTSIENLHQVEPPSANFKNSIPNCSGGCDVNRTVKYGDLDMDEGEVAIITGTCPPDNNQQVDVYSSHCFNIGTQVTGVEPAKLTQVLTYSNENLSGKPKLYKSTSVNTGQLFCLDAADKAITTASASFAVSSFGNTATTTCELESVGRYCYKAGTHTNENRQTKCNSSLNSDSSIIPKSGEATLLPAIDKSYDTEKCCSIAYKFTTSCDDLSLIGFDDAAYGVLLGNNTTEVTIFQDSHFNGLKTRLDHSVNAGLDPTESYYKFPATSDGINAIEGSISSLDVRTGSEIGAITLITTKVCTDCNFAGMNLSRQKLNDAVVTRSNFTNATLTYTQLSGAYMQNTTLVGVKGNYANLSGAYLTNATMSDASDSKASASFKNAYFAGADLTGVTANYVHFDNAQFVDSGNNTTSLSTASLVGAYFNSAIFDNVNLSEITIAKTSFDSAVILNSNFTGVVDNSNSTTNLSSFSNAVLYGSTFASSHFDYVDFESALFSFVNGSYTLNAYSSFDSETFQYHSEENDVNYEATYPDKAPASTSNNTTCPDGSYGPCNKNGGETAESCPEDCAGEPECLTNWNCHTKQWTDYSVQGHWFCNGGTCDTCSDSVNCNDGFCDMFIGETALSCRSDCINPYPPECTHGSQCLTKEWPLETYGHWECHTTSGNPSCTAIEDDSSTNLCGDGICSQNGQWMPQQPSIYIGKNNIHSWVRPEQGVCK